MRRSSSPLAEHRLAHVIVTAALAIALCLTLTACDDITSLDQEAPSRIPADSLERPENAPLLLQSAIGDFECALASYIVAAGLVGDELANSSGFNRLWEYDRRTVVPTNSVYSTTECGGDPTVYTVLSTARYSADNALRLLDAATDEQVPDRTALTATAAAYAGYSLVLLGEGMCSAAIDVGPELTPAQLLTQAEARFTRAVDAGDAGGDGQILNLALLGRARARLGLGNLPGAAEDAALIPEGFLLEATYSTARARRENLVFTYVSLFLAGTVDVPFRDLAFEGVPDPRVPVVDAEMPGADGDTPAFLQAKYGGFDSPIPVARWEEAQLILAEAAVASGDVAGAVGIINTLHDNAGLPPHGGERRRKS
jgi:starch-binding outer membrane protein, SusD/RagB family